MRSEKILVTLILAIGLTACNNKQNTTGATQYNDSAGIIMSDEKLPVSPPNEIALTSGGKTPRWLAEVIMKYLRGTDNEFVRSIGAENESWIIDNVAITDTGKYIFVQIGHSVAEDDGSNKRFVTDQWIGVDSATGIIYEFDVGSDTTFVWNINGK
jgi:hypothetical protein